MSKPEWCWFEDDRDNPKGPFPSKQAAIDAANHDLTEEDSDCSTFLVAPCLRPNIADCFPEEDSEVAGHIMEMLDENTEEFFRDPDDISYELVAGANVGALRSFLTEWAKKYVKHTYLLPDPNATEEVSRIVTKE
jgi:hypothetical protein